MPNKATADVRATIALIAERNVARLEKWLVQVGEKDPARAADIFLKLAEYSIPKLSRVEVGGALEHKARLEIGAFFQAISNKSRGLPFAPKD